jgi:serine protease Do
MAQLRQTARKLQPALNSASSQLVKARVRLYPDAMLKPSLFATALWCGAASWVSADTIQLKDKAAITGQVLAEKRDSVAVDVGYTVLVIPRNQIEKIEKGAPAEKPTKSSAKSTAPKPAPAPEVKGGFFQSSSRPAPERNVRELVNALGEAVVQVRTPSGLGSGFFINDEGFLLTNFHVIEGETQLSVEVYHQKNGQLERKTYKEVRIVAMNKFEDMALLQVQDQDAPKFKTVTLGSADALDVGQRVFAIGSPLGLERTVTEGILSTKTRQIGGELYLQTTTAINPGNSGGPLFNLGGEVVGITNMKITFGEGLGFAIPVESVRFFLEHRDAYAYSTDNPSNPYRYLEPPSKLKKNNTP